MVEVSQTRLALDRTRKASIYARANVVEVHRDPTSLEPSRRGWAYRSVRTLQPGASVAPLAAPNALIAVADLLP